MNEELKKLLDQIKNKKKEVKDLCAANKLEDAKKAKEELVNLQDQFDILYDLEDEHLDDIEDQVNAGTAKKLVDNTKKVMNAFVNAIKAGISKKTVSAEDMEILNSMKEGTDEDGGLTVPQDIRTQVKELRRSEDALENLVNVEPVATLSGSRVIELQADQTPFDNVDEAAEFPEDSTPQFDNIEYKVKKKGGILKVTYELLQDSAENILRYLKKWIAKKSKATRNFMIIAKIREITKDAEIAVDSLDDLKHIFNVTLDPAIALTSGVVTNQDGYNWLDTLKDSQGKYILQPDPTKPTQMMLFGKYPIKKVSNKTLKSKIVTGGYKVPIVCGDLKEAITIFDRETLTIDINSVAGDLWGKDQTGIKVRERLDIKAVDTEAIVMAEHLIKTDSNSDGTYSQAELEAMTKAQILETATKIGYTLTKDATNTKADIITDFLAKQTAAAASSGSGTGSEG